MHAFKQWLDRSPTAQAVLVFVLCAGIGAVLERHDPPAVWLAKAALYTVVGVAVAAVRRRRVSRAAGTDARGYADLNRKIRHGEVPGDRAERETMRRLVAEQLDRMERAGRWLPYWLGSMALIAAGVVVLGLAAGALALPLVFGPAMIAFCCWIVWRRRRSLREHRAMSAALDSRGDLSAARHS
ncbi:hypothetical protein ACF073_28235 [Streptomyces sp. NPDC015171]|uniref:hypothetical protein n=1 Tax=Streptomyces sp. NPDC015171 TaxID=3364945 RepID=UPI0036FA0832